MTSFRYVFTIACFIAHNEASRILAVFPTPSISHQVVFRPLVEELVKRGHEVVVVTTDPVYKNGGAPTNLTEIDVHDLSYGIWRREFLPASVTSGSKEELSGQVSMSLKILMKVFEEQMLTTEFQKLLKDKSQKFDLLLLEAFFTPLLALSHVFKAPVIQVSSLGNTEDNLHMVGAVSHPILYPTAMQQTLNHISLFEKLSEIYHYYDTLAILAAVEKIYDERIAAVFGTETPPLTELKNNVDMLFVNIHPIWENNRPVPPNVIYMGGLHQKPEKELPQDLKNYLDSSKNGVIYISFGTNVDPALLPPEKIQTMINVLSKLPYDILWKWNQDELPGRTPNIRISKWLPQSDLLRHPKVKLFITQGGLQSTDEAITAGVPLIGMPMLGDQWFNVEQYVHYNIGIRVDMDTVSEDKLSSAIQTILKDNKSYRQNIVHLRSIMRDQPQSPLERAVWWTEHVLRHSGARHLRAAAANLPLYQYLELELVTYVVLALLTVVTLTLVTLYSLYSLVSKKFVRQKVKSS
uniref:UDP-glucuronosyltransferase n=1 Tax=Ostrinia furnacalis TaxID=93504 RepID=A0A7H1CRG4_OSTFU|nr:UDP-glycosyltransferase UGT33AL1 [Ostrinia furnacalis]